MSLHPPSFIQLGSEFFERTEPTPVRQPELLLFNEAWAKANLAPESLPSSALELAKVFCGNQTLPGSEPIACAYAGHQFGHYNPRLGDGRAHLLGELKGLDGSDWEVQLKGSGITDFSRGGDGRCALAPALREYLMSEAMYALGVPTGRCLAVVSTGETVYRQGAEPGAIVTRLMASHLRVGSFQYAANQLGPEATKRLLDYAIARHYPHIDPNDAQAPLLFLQAVAEKQRQLIKAWMRVGFIHGVMNTDNCAISGDTIDYGPCAMLGTFDLNQVYSSIDQQGRYAFGRQPHIAQWNLARLTETLLPLMPGEKQEVLAKLQDFVDGLGESFERDFGEVLAQKLGLSDADKHQELIATLVERMQQQGLDYTQTFDRLTESQQDSSLLAPLQAVLGDWLPLWHEALASEPNGAYQLMRAANPRVIPRNHWVEAVLEAAVEHGDLAPFKRFLKVLQQPYQQLDETSDFQSAKPEYDLSYQTFCGT
ncbi:protein adenylyltransferase SelO [Paraferrimonas sedimenticola]|uniref:Protein nucleotidyltransferase YdiU n=1 Tax=Paraferrimonas sedimenticola TaxID=375674 RepID=A0AA37W210_9GAMM|nr:YdiU family protein [Paraferrimonas sedimenticola]GLP97585.1 UPF0061 protein [Paraferrimonas sedimenticola]